MKQRNVICCLGVTSQGSLLESKLRLWSRKFETVIIFCCLGCHQPCPFEFSMFCFLLVEVSRIIWGCVKLFFFVWLKCCVIRCMYQNYGLKFDLNILDNICEKQSLLTLNCINIFRLLRFLTMDSYKVI